MTKKFAIWIFALVAAPMAMAALTIRTDPASNVTASTAYLVATLTDTSAIPAQVAFYWGLSDGGTNAGAWANAQMPSTNTYGTGTVSTALFGLTAGTTYYFRAMAFNTAETAWAASSTNFIPPVSTPTGNVPAAAYYLEHDSNYVVRAWNEIMLANGLLDESGILLGLMTNAMTNCVLVNGNQNVAGIKTFADTIICSNITGVAHIESTADDSADTQPISIKGHDAPALGPGNGAPVQLIGGNAAAFSGSAGNVELNPGNGHPSVPSQKGADAIITCGTGAETNGAFIVTNAEHIAFFSKNGITISDESNVVQIANAEITVNDEVLLARDSNYIVRAWNEIMMANGLFSETGSITAAMITNALKSLAGAGLFATGTPVYVEADPVWSLEKSGYATGTPLYVQSETNAEARVSKTANETIAGEKVFSDRLVVSNQVQFGVYSIAENDGVVLSGYSNVARSGYAAVLSGQQNIATGVSSVVAGGILNWAIMNGAAIGGGIQNIGHGYCSTVPGGQNCTAGGAHSFAAGNRAKAMHDGSFVWADARSLNKTSVVENSVAVYAEGGFYLFDGSYNGNAPGLTNLNLTKNSNGASWITNVWTYLDATTNAVTVTNIYLGAAP